MFASRWLYELTVIRSITMATLVINHRRGHYLDLRNASTGRLRTRSYTIHFWRSFQLPIFIHAKGRTRSRLTRTENSWTFGARISAALICFVCIVHYGIQSVGRKTNTIANRGTKGRAKVPVDKSGHVGNFGHVKISRGPLSHTSATKRGSPWIKPGGSRSR